MESQAFHKRKERYAALPSVGEALYNREKNDIKGYIIRIRAIGRKLLKNHQELAFYFMDLAIELQYHVIENLHKQDDNTSLFK